MSKRKVSLRLPAGVLRAYDAAEANRSKLMRRVLSEAVSDGRVEVPDDIQALAAVEDSVDKGALDRRRGTFRKRCAEFYADKYRSGYTTPDDAEDMAASWRKEAAIYGGEYLAWVDAVVAWYRENWDITEAVKEPWPDPGVFHARARPGDVDVSAHLVSVLEDARDDGLDPAEAVSRVSKFHPAERVEAAAKTAYGAAYGGGK